MLATLVSPCRVCRSGWARTWTAPPLHRRSGPVTADAVSGADAERLGRPVVELTRSPEVADHGPAGPLDLVPPARLVDRALLHRVPGVVYRALQELDADGPDFAGLRSAYQMATLAHGRCLAELASVAGSSAGRAADGWWSRVRSWSSWPTATRGPGSTRTSTSSSRRTARVGAGRPRGQRRPCGRPELDDDGRPVRAEVPMELAHGMLGDLHWHLLVTASIR